MQNSSNKPLVFTRAITAFILPDIYLFICYGTDLALFLLLPTLLLVSIAYIVPFFINSTKIKNERVEGIKGFIFCDFLFSFIPSVVGCFFVSLFLYIFFKEFSDIWFFTTIIIVVYTVLTLYFWLRYYVVNCIAHRKERCDK